MGETSKKESQSEGIKCGNCGYTNTPERTSCLRCGGGLGKPGNSERGLNIKELEIKPNTCGNCGYTNTPERTSCLRCGGGLT